jgi:hypothetical protein
MTMRRLRIGLLLTTVLAVLWASGCGGGSDKHGKRLPSQQSAALQRELDSVQRRFEFGDGACKDIQNSSRPDVEAILASIPTGVKADVRDALRQSFDHLWELASSQCDTAKNQPTTPRTTPTPTHTTPTQTQTQTETTPTQTQTQPKKPKKKPNDNQGTGGGDTGGAADPGSG